MKAQICPKCFKVRICTTYGYYENWQNLKHLQEHLLKTAEKYVCRNCKIGEQKKV